MNDLIYSKETYLKIISAKTAELFAAATKVGAILSGTDSKKKDALEEHLVIKGRNRLKRLPLNSILKKFTCRECWNSFSGYCYFFACLRV